MCNSLGQQQNVVTTSTQQPAKHLGMTSPISLNKPRPEDIQKSEQLLKVLESHGIFETEEELNHRMEIISKLSTLFKQWIKEISVAKDISEEAAEKLGGKIYTFGSYRLGVHDKGSDIDALCVAPLNIERADFFSSFFTLLKIQPEVTECRAIEETFVPVIKLNFDGIEIDLLFAKLSLKVIPDDLDLRDNNLLRHLDQYSIRSLNGYRVTEEIQSLVPNLDTFRLTLRSIKLWAKKHGIYSNSLGYFGGVTWAILVARTCQLYPNATASTLVNKFFLILSRWKWPSPILLKRPDIIIDSTFKVWDPRINISDSFHLMPIITPAYPHQNSTFNVSESTKKVMLMEFNRGLTTTDKIMLGKASWNTFFEAPSFFNRYRHFVVLRAHSKTADDHLEWCGLVESKIRKLVAMLERNQHISLAHVHPKCFDPKKPANIKNSSLENSSCNEGEKSENDASAAFGQPRPFSSPYCSMWFIGFKFQRSANLNVDLTANIRSFTDQVMQHGVKIKMLRDGMSIDAQRINYKELSQYLDNDLLQRDRKSINNHNSCSNAIKANRKRSSSEMHQKDAGSNGTSCTNSLRSNPSVIAYSADPVTTKCFSPHRGYLHNTQKVPKYAKSAAEIFWQSLTSRTSSSLVTAHTNNISAAAAHSYDIFWQSLPLHTASSSESSIASPLSPSTCCNAKRRRRRRRNNRNKKSRNNNNFDRQQQYYLNKPLKT